ncbi:MAG: tetratricopeptide repeat protein, partial [Gammaproteobacteria bacterium]|nr:tetratricopeptide repeat protein [Gammaproteobacteria bacterium]
FWAEWCGPCRNLAPILERLITRLDGKVLLAKLDTDANPQLAQQAGIRSLPTIRLFKNGQAVAELIGLNPEPAIAQMLEQHLPRPADPVIEAARRAMAGGDVENAIAALRAASGDDPDYPPLRFALCEAHLLLDQLDEAEQALVGLPANVLTEDAAMQLKARLDLARSTSGLASLDDLAQRVESDPDDLDARLDLAARLAEVQQYEPAMEALLSVIKRRRDHADGAARKRLLAMFELLGPRDERVMKYRSALASALN